MEIVDSKFSFKFNKNLYLKFNINEALFFDIETTGFSPQKTKLYLIGCAYFDGIENEFCIKQWFMNDYADEAIMLSSFFDFVSGFKYIVHYNGNGFDIPYIIEKCKHYNMSYDFSSLISIDIYKEIFPIKNIFKLENTKQKSIEGFLNIPRDDKYSGGELIPMFYEYLENHSDKCKAFLLEHNHDDLAGLIKILPILNYTSIFNDEFTINNVKLNYLDKNYPKEVIFECKTLYPSPVRISFGNSTYYVTWMDTTLKIKAPIYSGGLKYFYPNYKDYYYLPKEDCSIHKSVAFYVDKNYRTKANAANCYSKKTGRFIPQINEIIKPYFKIDYYDKTTYFELTKELIDTPNALKGFIIDIINSLKKIK